MGVFEFEEENEKALNKFDEFSTQLFTMLAKA